MGGGWNGLGIKNLWRENGLGFSGSVGWETDEKNLWWPRKILQKKKRLKFESWKVIMVFSLHLVFERKEQKGLEILVLFYSYDVVQLCAALFIKTIIW